MHTMLEAHVMISAYISGALDRLRDERGQGSVEYAGMVLLVGIVVAAAITLLDGDNVIGTEVKSAIESAFQSLSG